MKKIIGRGVLLLLKSQTDVTGLKLGFQLSSEGIRFYFLGGDLKLLTLKEALKKDNTFNTATSLVGKGHLILNDLPASPNDAFYNILYTASDITRTPEPFSLLVREDGPFAHGPQTHFSGLDLTFQFNNTGELSILSGGKVSLVLNKGVFSEEQIIKLKPEWRSASETIAFTDPELLNQISLDRIGHLSKIVVELAPAYDRWAQMKGLYAFDGFLKSSPTTNEFAAHDISGQGAPSLFFEGIKDIQSASSGTIWTEKGIKITGNSLLANPEKTPNPVVESIQQSESFSVELWVKPERVLQEGPAQIFSIENSQKFFFLGHGPWITENFKKRPGAPAGSWLNVNYGPFSSGIPMIRSPYWQYPFLSPANSLSTEVVHVVYTYDQISSTQRIFINGVQVAQKSDPGNYIDWSGDLRIAVGNNIGKNRPWNGEVHQIAIFNRALSAEEVDQHYHPVLKISGAFSLDNVISPLNEMPLPFRLNIEQASATLIADQEMDLDIKPGLGFRHVYLECKKLPESAWAFSGKFQTRFWEDMALLDATNIPSGPLNVASLQLNSPPAGSEPANTPKLGILSTPHLMLTEPFALKGNWLEDRITFTSEESGKERVLNGSTTFILPFTLNLPAKIDPETGDMFGQDILLNEVEMTILLNVTLRKEGFMGVVTASFNHENKKKTLPERRIYEAPVSKLALLGSLLDEVKVQSDALFAEHRKHQEDYYLATSMAGLPFIHLSTTGTQDLGIKSVLPRVFSSNPTNPFVSSPHVFSLAQNDANCELNLNLNGLDNVRLREAYDKFIAQVEGQNGLSPAGLRLIQGRIAERLPLDIDTLLYYYYGWDIRKNYIDLHPGMQLRVDFQHYQFVHATDQRAKNGFVGGGSITTSIHSYTDETGAQFLGFGSFLSRLQSNNLVNIVDEGVGGLLELGKAGSRKKFFRLFFPKELVQAASPKHSVTFVGADRWQDLPESIPFTNTGSQISFFFRDKAMVIPEIQIYVGNRELYVPIGTTVRQLIEKYANIPAAISAGPDLNSFLGNTRPRRLIHTGPNSNPAYRFLNFGINKVQNNRDFFDLPLIKGDRFYF